MTAKLSSKFYERFGDDIAGELVDWFNAVDHTYQTQLKETNELNWERFKATLQAETASIRGEMAKMDAGLRAEMVKSHEGLLRAMEVTRADLHKWMFVYWSGSMVGLGGLIVGMQLFSAR